MDHARKNLENIEVNFENVRPSRHKFDGESGLRELLINELKPIYYAEKAILKSFPKLIKNSCSFELIETLTIHQEKTKSQIIRLEDVFSLLAESPVMERCMAIEAMIGNIDLNIEDTKFGMIRDAAIILGMQQIQCYEIATYSILATYAENLGHEEIAGLLCENVNDEKIMELRLSKIAQTIRFYASETL